MKIATLAAVLALASASIAAADPSQPSAGARAQAAAQPIGPPPPGQARVVFYRPSALYGFIIGYSVRENGLQLNTLSNGRYFIVDASPGAHTFTVAVSTTSRLTLDVAPGRTYYVWAGLESGFGGDPSLEPSEKSDFDGAFARGKLKLAPGAKPAA